MKYKSIIEQIICDIENGKLPQGHRMSSLRKMAILQNVSITTIQNAFHALEELGWLIAKPQAGFFVTRPLIGAETPVMPQFASRAVEIEKRLDRVDFKNSTFVGPLGISQLASHLVPYEAFKRSVRRVMNQSNDDIHFYPSPNGEPALKKAICHQFMQYGFPFLADQIVITNGCIDAIRISLETVTKRGDAVAISSPCFSGLIDLLAELGRKVVEIPCLPDGIDLDQFEQHIKRGKVQAGLFSTSHMNPQGISLSTKQKQSLAKLANYYEIPVIEDDVYLELGHQKTTPLPAKYWDSNGYILWCGSISKTLSAGLRIGWCLPGRFQESYTRKSYNSNLGVSNLMQAAVADFISTGQYNKHIQATRVLLRQQVLAYRSFVAQVFPADTATSSPEGGVVLWIQIRSLDSDKFIELVAKTNIDIRFGCNFTTLPLYKDCIRINCGYPLDISVQDQLTKLANLAEKCQSFSP